MTWRAPFLAGLLFLVVLVSLAPSGPSRYGTGSAPAAPPLRTGGEPPRFVGGAPTIDAALAHSTVTTALEGRGPASTLQNRSAWLAYYSATTSFYVAVSPSSLDVIPYAGGTLPVGAVIPVGTDPFGVAVDPVTGDVFVTNTGSDNVTVVSSANNTTIANVPVGHAPMGIAYDNRSETLYVANSGSDNVTAISGATLKPVASISVRHVPIGIAYDPASDRLFVADHGAAAVSVISAATNTLLGRVDVGDGPYGVAIDPVDDTVYVTNEVSANVSVISVASSTVVASVQVVLSPADLQGLAFDPHDGYVWIGAGLSYAAVLDPSTHAIVDFVNTDPSGVVFDPDTNDICVTDTGNVTFACMLFPNVPALSLTFEESGLPQGTWWNVTVALANFGSSPAAGVGMSMGNSSTIAVGLLSGNYNYTVWAQMVWVHSGNSYWRTGYAVAPGSGSVTVTANTTVTVLFAESFGPFDANFSETGLPPGTEWGIAFTNWGNFETNESSLLPLSVPSGTYSYQVLDVPGWVEVNLPPKGFVDINGSSVSLSFHFVPYVYQVTFHQRGTNGSVPWTVVFNDTSRTVTETATFWAPNGSYAYSVTPPAGFVGTASGTFVVAGANVTVWVAFVQLYEVTFGETGLPSGTVWNVTVGASTYSSDTSEIALNATNGSYPYLVGGVDNYSATPAWGTLVVAGGPFTVGITFLPPAQGTYSITFTESGLSVGTVWSVSVYNQTQGVDETLRAMAPSSLTFFLPNGTYSWGVFVPAGYTLTSASTSVAVQGGPVAPLAVPFGHPSPSTAPSAGALPDWAWIAVATVAAVAGFTGGLLSARRRPPRGA